MRGGQSAGSLNAAAAPHSYVEPSVQLDDHEELVPRWQLCDRHHGCTVQGYCNVYSYNRDQRLVPTREDEQRSYVKRIVEWCVSQEIDISHIGKEPCSAALQLQNHMGLQCKMPIVGLPLLLGLCIGPDKHQYVSIDIATVPSMLYYSLLPGNASYLLPLHAPRGQNERMKSLRRCTADCCGDVTANAVLAALLHWHVCPYNRAL